MFYNIGLAIKALSVVFVGSVFLICCGTSDQTETLAQANTVKPTRIETAIFAGGCFWCVESDFDKVNGVFKTVSGYTGGETMNPTYEQVTYKDTGHYEAVEVSYDPNVVSYEKLVRYFFRHVDPTDPNGQFCDKGASYRTAIFAKTGEETEIAKVIKAEFDAKANLPGPIVTPILPVSTFWPAETYHQDYYQKNPVRYRYYRFNCGRDAKVKQVWKNAP